MYVDHPPFGKPDNENSKIWRYLDFAKFVSLLDTKKLFFVRADKLPDRFEGFWEKTNESLNNYIEDLKKNTYINCWQKNEHESALMWDVYPKSDNGIAIQSTFKRSTQSFDDFKPDVYIREVHYTNSVLNSEPEYTMQPFLRKRIYFKDDHEIRAMFQKVNIQDRESDSTIDFVDHGIYIPVSLNKLIESIYTSPKASKWFHNLVQSIVNKYKLDIEVISSPLGDVPKGSKVGKNSESKITLGSFDASRGDTSGNIRVVIENGVDETIITDQKK